MSIRKEKAIDIMLDRLESIYEVYEGRDFVEVIGEIGGDVERHWIYFDRDDNVVGQYEK